MVSDKMQHCEKLLKEAFEEGYKNAAQSFSKIIEDKISYNNFHHSHHEIKSFSIGKITPSNRDSSATLITTEVFGDIHGKSYFLLSKHEFELMTQHIPAGKYPAVDIKEEFVKELDNILSAAVISKLVDQLGIKMYGNVPIWNGSFNGNVGDRIHQDFSRDSMGVYISSTYFSFTNFPQIQPLFIWAIDAKVMEVMDLNLTY
jgi:chemotaxis protein CheY-P-specific phosphatase CheC